MQEGIRLKVQVVFQEKKIPLEWNQTFISLQFKVPTVADIQHCGNKGATGYVCVCGLWASPAFFTLG